ncbi:MAG TPA: phosphonate ABC transporter, permease protein PhnE [Chloroflexia bacterium]|nr:phosphonate ABC transporter, permease protein PhnE [Chloroflexia bacterium]
MAKVDQPPARATAPGTPAPAAPLSARERYALHQSQNRRMSTYLLPVLFLVLAWAHVAGWQISQIDPIGFTRDAPKMVRIIKQLTAPDVVIYEQTALLNARVAVPGAGDVPLVDNPPLTTTLQVQPQIINQPAAAAAPVAGTTPDAGAVSALPAGGQAATPTAVSIDVQNVVNMPGTQAWPVTMQIEPGAVMAEQPVTVTGHVAFPPEYKGHKAGFITWTRTGGFPKTVVNFETDEAGNFSTVFQAPDSSQVQEENELAATFTWGVGNLQWSPTLVGENGVLNKIIETIFQALMGTSLAVLVSLPLAFFAASNIMGRNPVGRVIYYLARTLLNLLRSVEVLIMATIFVAAVGIGPFAGVLALIVHSVASLGKLYSEAIESIDPGPIEAITATGAGRLQTIVFAVIPQFIPQFVSFTLYRWDVNVRMSTIIGFVGGGGIGFLLTQYIQLLDWSKAGTAIWVIAIVVIVIDLASARIRQAVI